MSFLASIAVECARRPVNLKRRIIDRFKFNTSVRIVFVTLFSLVYMSLFVTIQKHIIDVMKVDNYIISLQLKI